MVDLGAELQKLMQNTIQKCLGLNKTLIKTETHIKIDNYLVGIYKGEISKEIDGKVIDLYKPTSRNIKTTILILCSLILKDRIESKFVIEDSFLNPQGQKIVCTRFDGKQVIFGRYSPVTLCGEKCIDACKLKVHDFIKNFGIVKTISDEFGEIS